MYIVNRFNNIPVLIYSNDELTKGISNFHYYTQPVNDTKNFEIYISTSQTDDGILVTSNAFYTNTSTNIVENTIIKDIGEVKFTSNLSFVFENNSITICDIISGNISLADNILTDNQSLLLNSLEDQNELTHFHSITINEEGFEQVNSIDINDENNDENQKYAFHNRLSGERVYANNKTELVNLYNIYKDDILEHYGFRIIEIDNVLELLPEMIITMLSRPKILPQPNVDGLNTI